MCVCVLIYIIIHGYIQLYLIIYRYKYIHIYVCMYFVYIVYIYIHTYTCNLRSHQYRAFAWLVCHVHVLYFQGWRLILHIFPSLGFSLESSLFGACRHLQCITILRNYQWARFLGRSDEKCWLRTSVVGCRGPLRVVRSCPERIQFPKVFFRGGLYCEKCFLRSIV